jgi:hypothetical protein
MTEMYSKRISSLSNERSSWLARMASRILRWIDRSLPFSVVFLTSCCVIVEPPWLTPRLRRSATSARRVPRTSTPPWE